VAKLEANRDLTFRKSPAISFPVTTERVFADYKHKTLVPSPDRYYVEDHERRDNGKLYGTAFHAQKDSQHVDKLGIVISSQPARFDAYIDEKNA